MKKAGQTTKDNRVYPAFNFLTASFHSNETGAMQLLYMMGYRRRYYVQVTAQITHTRAHAIVSVKGTYSSRNATGDKMQEHSKAVGVRQSLENLSKLFDLFISIFRHISKYMPPMRVCQDLFLNRMGFKLKSVQPARIRSRRHARLG
jgi:hypothetical protein